MVVKQHKQKMVPYKNSYTSRRMGMFLMAVILVMENDVDFLTSITEKPEWQNVLCLNLDTDSILNLIPFSGEFDLAMCQFANNFLINNQ